MRIEPGAEACPALFLDRDGVIVEDNGFLCEPDEAKLMPGAVQLVAAANRNAIPVAVVTNQSGIDRGLYGWAEFAAVQTRIEQLLAADGAAIDALAACPFHPDFTPGFGAQHAHWRKPGAGLILAPAERLNIDLGRSWLVGDKPSDIEAARKAGLAGAVRLPRLHGDPDSTGPTPAGGPGFEVLDADRPDSARRLLESRLLTSANCNA